jgi:ATP-binding cassette subfamily F protein uup
MREQLDPNCSVFDSIADGADFVRVAGDEKHVLTYLQDFLFPPDRARAPVAALSGGERNRLLLARLFIRPFNLLVLDEPTNDLDIETLDLLEQLLIDFSGTLLVVSHDREFLDNVVTSTLVFEGSGNVGEYVGGYSDWLRQRPQLAKSVPRSALPAKATTVRAVKPPKRQLSFKESTELKNLPDRIDEKERERERVYSSLADPAVLRDGAASAAAKARVMALDAEIAKLTERWEALETIVANG